MTPTTTKETHMRTDIPVTPSSDFYLKRAEAKRQRRIERNRRIFGSAAPLVDYELLTVSALYELAKDRGLKVTTKTRKSALIEMLSV
jgi:hypothetical protein